MKLTDYAWINTKNKSTIVIIRWLPEKPPESSARLVKRSNNSDRCQPGTIRMHRHVNPVPNEDCGEDGQKSWITEVYTKKCQKQTKLSRVYTI